MDNESLWEAIVGYLLQRVHYLEAEVDSQENLIAHLCEQLGGYEKPVDLEAYSTSQCTPEEFWGNK